MIMITHERSRLSKDYVEFVFMYSVIHLLVVDILCVLFLTQSACMAPKQNTRNIYHKQMNNGVCLPTSRHVASMKVEMTERLKLTSISPS